MGAGRRARWRRSVLRRVVSALLAGAAVGLVVTELRPPPPPTTPVLVAARPVAAGEVLGTADLRVVPVSSGAIQPGALTSVPDAVGRRVGAGLAAGEALTATRLVPRSPVDGLPPGRVALHVVAADPASVDLLAPGDAARVYPAGGGAPLAVAARVLATDPPGTSPDSLTTSGAAARGVVLSLSAPEADAVLGGHGAVDGPVTVSVVGAPG
jgi:pilus assembly protein CpaB